MHAHKIYITPPATIHCQPLPSITDHATAHCCVIFIFHTPLHNRGFACAAAHRQRVISSSIRA